MIRYPLLQPHRQPTWYLRTGYVPAVKSSLAMRGPPPRRLCCRATSMACRTSRLVGARMSLSVCCVWHDSINRCLDRYGGTVRQAAQTISSRTLNLPLGSAGYQAGWRHLRWGSTHHSWKPRPLAYADNGVGEFRWEGLVAVRRVGIGVVLPNRIAQARGLLTSESSLFLDAEGEFPS